MKVALLEYKKYLEVLMKLLLLIAIVLTSPAVQSQESDFFKPLREGPSIYSFDDERIQELTKHRPQSEIINGVGRVLQKAFNNELEAPEVISALEVEFTDFIDSCKKRQECRKKRLKTILQFARINHLFDDVFLILMTEAIDGNGESTLPSLTTYYYRLDITQKLREKYGEDKSPVLENLLNQKKEYIKKEKKLGGLSPRQRIFLFYSDTELEILTDVLRSFLNRNFANESYIVYQYDSEKEEKIELSETEKYKSAVKLFNRDLNRLYSNQKIKRIPLYSELLALALETGLISIRMLNEMLKLPEIHDPYTPFWTKVGNMTVKLARNALVINPATSIYAMSAFLVLDGMKQIKEENEKISDDHLF